MKRFTSMAVASLLAVSVLAGCGGAKPQNTYKSTTPTPAAQSTDKPANPVTLKIGLLPTIDGLPFWEAEAKNYYDDAGVKVELVKFNSASERDSAIQAGQVDGALNDPVASATLTASGTKFVMVSVCLGVKKQEGPYAIVAAPNSGITTVDQLKGVPIAMSMGSSMQYVAERLLQENGLKPDEIKETAIPAIPVRYEALMSGQVKAAILPDPLLALAVTKGAKLIVSDVDAKTNWSQSVISFTDKAIKEKADGITRFFRAYNRGVADIALNPNSFRAMLVDKAGLPKELKDSYQVVPFSPATAPNQANVEDVVNWLSEKQLIKSKPVVTDLVNASLLPKY